MNSIVAVIPTKLNRPRLLERSIASIANQTRQPDLVIICCDCLPEEVRAFRERLKGGTYKGKVKVITNRRTPGLSGNLNSGFELLNFFEPNTTLISLLDDDDYWSPNYLATAEEQFSLGYNLIVAPFHYVREGSQEVKLRLPPSQINADMFLKGNPGISNSTMSIGLEQLQSIKGWNEALESCTDRDACLRLIRVSANYSVAHGAVSYIDRNHGYSRLTDRGQRAKFHGLEAFYYQWRREMSDEVYQISRARAWELFNYDPGLAIAPQGVIDEPHSLQHLVVAIISVNPTLCSRLLNSLNETFTDKYKVTALILRNNPKAKWPLPEVDQIEQLYFDTDSGDRVLKIAEARNVLQSKLREYAHRQNTKPLIWLLDEDFICRAVDEKKVSGIIDLDHTNYDAIIGGYESDSPNAAFSGLLYELMDLEKNFHWIESNPQDKALPDRRAENDHLQASFPNTYHYALSLESKPNPKSTAWLEPAFENETNKQAKHRILSKLNNIISGTSIFRPLRDRNVPADLTILGPSIIRGGNIFILNLSLLEIDYPQIEGINGPVRRSDMMWALLAKTDRGFNLQKANIYTRHKRGHTALSELSLEKTTDELVGSCVFNSLNTLYSGTNDKDFSEILGARSQKTIQMLTSYFTELDIALERLEKLDSPEISALVLELRNILNSHFSENLIKEVERLTMPSKAHHIQRQFERHLSKNKPEVCDLVRGDSKYQISTHYNEKVQLIQVGDISSHLEPLIRVHSSCIFSEVFGATDCDCASQLDAALRRISEYGCGAVIYVKEEGRGHGLQEKIKIIKSMQENGLDTYQACERLGLDVDVRNYEKPIALLRQKGIHKFRLLTNNPLKVDSFLFEGFDVKAAPLRGVSNWDNQDYLLSKERFNHKGLLLESESLNGVSFDSKQSISFESTNGPWGEFSNFSGHAVFEHGVIWPSAEHLYQAKKFISKSVRENIRRSKSPANAKQIARQMHKTINLDWDDLKLMSMYSVVNLKMRQHPEVLARLLSTGNKNIIEISKEDTYWGCIKTGEGHNYLGKILMLIRTEHTQGL